MKKAENGRRSRPFSAFFICLKVPSPRAGEGSTTSCVHEAGTNIKFGMSHVLKLPLEYGDLKANQTRLIPEGASFM
jgi:hypothetical protein